MGANESNMTDLQFAKLWYLFDVVSFDPGVMRSLDECLQRNSYIRHGSGWDALIEWIEGTYSVSSSGIT